MAPVVSDVEPNQGPATGGNAVVISGNGFTGATQVRFGTVSAAFIVNTNSKITATAPPATGPGTVNVRVTGIGGTSGQLALYTYQAVSAPVITDVEPSQGPLTGGNAVVISGTGFTGTTQVEFGGVDAIFVVNSDSEITATAPPGNAPGTVDVTVTTSGGTSAPAPYTYLTLPAVIQVEPGAGPTSGGNTVTITGTNLTLAESVFFGATEAVSVVVVSDNQLQVTAPAGSGTVPVTVVTPGGASTPHPCSLYTYLDVPIVNGLDPDQGPSTGGNTVIVTGSNLTYANDVIFDSQLAAFTVISDQQIVATAPGGVGAVNVAVTNGAGTSTPGVPYTYQPADG
jgi:hypothetical protein